jgi:Mrp family chromosome partitioning ATPase/capsular polysaccharide biosynthesis protein
MEHDRPRYATLRDYLRVLRNQRNVIILVTLVFALAAFGLSVRQTPIYQADAALSFSDPAADLAVAGGGAVLPQRTSAQLAQEASTTVTRIPEMAAVKRDLKTPLSPEALQARLTTRVEIPTSFLVISAKDSNPKFAARLANSVARRTVVDTRQSQRRRYQTLLRALRKRLGQLNPSDPADAFNRGGIQQSISRLEALLSYSRPVQIARTALTPTRPISPRPIRNTLLGALIGLTLGIIAAFLRDSLDRRLRGLREIQDELKLPLLGHVSHGAMGASLANGQRTLSEEDLEAFRILRTNLEFLDVDHPVRSVVVTSALPQEGKSTVAASLACAMAAAGKRTLLVECDLRRPSLARRLGVQRSPGLADFLIGSARPAEVLQTVKHPFTTSRNGGSGEDPSGSLELVCITAGSTMPRPAEMLGSKRFRDFLTQVREAYEVVVLDTSPLLSVVDTLELIPLVDTILVCVRANRTTRDQAQAAQTTIEHFPERPMGLVVTDVRPGEDDDYGFYSYTYAYGSEGD